MTGVCLPVLIKKDGMATTFYRVSSGKHRNLHNLTVTIGNTTARLYTDGTGLMREIQESEGHPFIRAEVAEIFQQQPAEAGWVVTPLPPDEPEPPEEIVPVDIGESGQVTFTSDRIAGRLRDALVTVREKDTLLSQKDAEIARLTAQVELRDQKIGELQRENNHLQTEMGTLQHDRPQVASHAEYAAPAAPMVKGGKLTKARKNHNTELVADDESVGTLRDAQPKQTYDASDLDDIPRME